MINKNSEKLRGQSHTVREDYYADNKINFKNQRYVAEKKRRDEDLVLITNTSFQSVYDLSIWNLQRPPPRCTAQGWGSSGWWVWTGPSPARWRSTSPSWGRRNCGSCRSIHGCNGPEPSLTAPSPAGDRKRNRVFAVMSWSHHAVWEQTPLQAPF